MTEMVPEVPEVAGGVVVGDDGSECAAAAIVAAAEDAVRRAAPMHVVRAWTLTTAVRPADTPWGVVPSMTEFEAATLEHEQRRVSELTRESAVEAEVHVVHGQPAKVLIAASERADLLVVGTRGLGGFRQLVLGSVAEQCIRYASCSVLVVRDRVS